MRKVCYWCNMDIGLKEGRYEEGVFDSLCDDCARRLKLDEKLPELLQALVDLRKKNAEEQNRTPTFFTDPRQKD